MGEAEFCDLHVKYENLYYCFIFGATFYLCLYCIYFCYPPLPAFIIIGWDRSIEMPISAQSHQNIEVQQEVETCS